MVVQKVKRSGKIKKINEQAQHMFIVCNKHPVYRRAYVLRALPHRIIMALPLHLNTNRSVSNNYLDSTNPFHEGKN